MIMVSNGEIFQEIKDEIATLQKNEEQFKKQISSLEDEIRLQNSEIAEEHE